MISRKIELAKERAEKLKIKHDSLCAELAKKKSEISGLASGYDKYKDNPAMLAQMKELLKGRINELGDIDKRVKELGRELGASRDELNRLFEALKAQKRMPAPSAATRVVKIADTTVVDKMISQAMKIPPKAPLPKPEKPLPRPAAEKVIKEPVPEPVKPAPQEPKKEQPKEDLYDKAARESKAQEEFIKKMSGSSKDYGAA